MIAEGAGIQGAEANESVLLVIAYCFRGGYSESPIVSVGASQNDSTLIWLYLYLFGRNL